jgi:Tfp pilus assembly ATPase PilU
MQTFDQSLVRLVQDGLVTEEDAKRVATNPHDFVLALRGVLTRGAPSLGSSSIGSPGVGAGSYTPYS